MNEPMISRRALVAGMAAGAVLPAVPAMAKAAPVQPAAKLLDALAWQLLDLDPTTATSLGVDTGAHAKLRGRLGDSSLAGVEKKRAVLTDALHRLAATRRENLDTTTETSLAVAQSAFRTALDGMALPYGDVAIGGWRNTPYVIAQNVGAYLDIPQLLDGDQPVRGAADAEAYLARLAATPALLDGELERVRAARGKGLVPPDFIADRTISALSRCLADAAKIDGPFVGPLAHKTGGETPIPGDWTARAQRIAAEGIAPALERQLAEIRAQRQVAVSEPGMLRRPDGEQWYRWGLRASTTTLRPPQELHALGVAQLAELHARMDTILGSLGLSQGTVGERMTALQRRPEYAFANDDEGRRQVIQFMQGKVDAMRARMPRAFRRLMPGNLEIRRMPLAQEPGAPAAYGGAGSIDGKIPGKIWVNLGDLSIHNKVSIPDLVFHEGIPGHVWQGEYAQKLPLIRSILAFNAYSEGWALYAEQLADELGMYDGDPAGQLGYLMGLSWRAVRLVTDTGLHALGWTRARALAEFLAATGLPQTNAESEIDRYCAWPGQACGYMVGKAEITALRTRARRALGAKYNLRDFDQAVVDGGNVPLDVLANNVERYIAGTM